MEIDKVHQSLTNSSNDVTTITKLTSNISYSYTEDFYPNLNLSFSQTAEARLRTYDYPVLKRSQSHKRHHFKVDIGTIVNEELNEDDSENITSINYSQCSFASSQNNIDELDILNKFTLSPHLNSDIKEEYLSPKTQLLLANLNSEFNYTFNKLDEGVPEEEWVNLVSPNYRSISKVLVLSNDNGEILDNKDNDNDNMDDPLFLGRHSGEKEGTSYENKENNDDNKDKSGCNGNDDESFGHIQINRHNLSSLSNLSNQDLNEYNPDQVGVIPTIFSRILRQEVLRNMNNNNGYSNNNKENCDCYSNSNDDNSINTKSDAPS